MVLRASVLLLFAGMLFPGVNHLARSMIFPGCVEGLPDAASLARAWPGVEPFPYRTADGLALTGALARARVPDAPVVVYFHGNAESAAQNVPLAHDLALRGIEVLLVEYRGYAGMPGAPSEVGLYLDAQAALEALLATGVARERLFVVGRSLGSGVACEVAHRGFGRALVLVSPFTSLVDMGRRIVGPAAGFLIEDRFENARKIAELRIPVTVIHGTADQVVPYVQGKELAGRAKCGKLVTLEGVDHSDIPGIGRLIEEAVREQSR